MTITCRREEISTEWPRTTEQSPPSGNRFGLAYTAVAFPMTVAVDVGLWVDPALLAVLSATPAKALAMGEADFGLWSRHMSRGMAADMAALQQRDPEGWAEYLAEAETTAVFDLID